MGSPTGDLVALLTNLLEEQRALQALVTVWRDEGSRMDDFSRIRVLADRQQKVLAHVQRLVDAKAEKIVDDEAPVRERLDESETELRRAWRDLREAKDKIRELEDVVAKQRRAIEADRTGARRGPSRARPARHPSRRRQGRTLGSGPRQHRR